jgi:hypothetical protein
MKPSRVGFDCPLESCGKLYQFLYLLKAIELDCLLPCAAIHQVFPRDTLSFDVEMKLGY